MQEFEYRLEKEDYKNWIHWNVLKHESKKMKMVSALLYVAFLALFLGCRQRAIWFFLYRLS